MTARRSIWASAHRTHDAVCQECGDDFTAGNARAKWCATCKKVKAAESLAASRERNAYVKQGGGGAIENFTARQFEVVHDPTGDFAPGARFGVMDVNYSLEQGVWPVGLRLRDCRRRCVVAVVRVGSGEDEGLKLQRVGA